MCSKVKKEKCPQVCLIACQKLAQVILLKHKIIGHL